MQNKVGQQHQCVLCEGDKSLESEDLGHRGKSGYLCDAHQGGGLSYDLREAMAHGHEGKIGLGHRVDQVPRTQGQGDPLQHEDKEATEARSGGIKG